MHGKGQQAHHQALVGLRGVPGQGQRVRAVVLAIHVRDMQLRLEDRGLQGHGKGSGWTRGDMTAPMESGASNAMVPASYQSRASDRWLAMAAGTTGP